MRTTLLTFFLAALGSGCGKKDKTDAKTLTLATTTSTQDSGLLDDLRPAFQEQTGIEVKVVAVGSGQALQLGRRGDADVLLVHDPAGEEQFMEEGHGESRSPVMHNDFVIVGPEADPAGLQKQKGVVAAFRRLESERAAFVSRGDDSGTHQKEKAIWKKAGIDPKDDWHIRAGSGMGAVLRMASEKKAHTLADRGTYLALNKKLDLVVLVEGDEQLRNPYSVVVVSTEKHPGVNVKAARRFAEFLRAPETQGRIGRFGVEKFGQPLFYPYSEPEK